MVVSGSDIASGPLANFGVVLQLLGTADTWLNQPWCCPGCKLGACRRCRCCRGGVEGLHPHCVSVLHLWQALERRVGVQPSQGDGDSARTPVGSGWGQLHTSAHITPASPSSQPAEASQGSSLCAWLLEDRGDAARPGL